MDKPHRIRLRCRFRDSDGRTYGPGDVVSVPEPTAVNMVAHHSAEPIDPPPGFAELVRECRSATDRKFGPADPHRARPGVEYR